MKTGPYTARNRDYQRSLWGRVRMRYASCSQSLQSSIDALAVMVRLRLTLPGQRVEAGKKRWGYWERAGGELLPSLLLESSGNYVQLCIE